MMGRTLRAQVVTYLHPPFKNEMDGVVEVLQAHGERVTLSSLSEESIKAGWDSVKRRYASILELGESKPTRRARRKKLLPV